MNHARNWTGAQPSRLPGGVTNVESKRERSCNPKGCEKVAGSSEARTPGTL